MKPYFPLLVICVGVCQLHAAAQQRTMVVTTASSEVKKIEVSTLTRITFSKDLKEMIVSTENSDKIQTLEVDDIVNIVFTIDSTDDLAEQTIDDMRISHSGGIVTISTTGAIEYSVWDMSAIQVASGHGDSVVTLDLTTLAPGIYIIKANNKTIKFINH